MTKASLLSFGDRPLRRGISTPASIGVLPTILLSAALATQGAAPGTLVGNLAISDPGDGGWTFSLLNTAGGMFQITGSQLKVGNTALNHDTMPTPTVVIQATNGSLSITAPFTISVQAAPITLGALTLSNLTFAAGAAAGTVIGIIGGATPGSVITVGPADGRLAISSDGKLVAGLSASTAGNINVTLYETLPGATNSPRATPFTLTVSALAGVAYLDPAGSDANPGTQASPVATFTRAFQLAGNGGNIFVKSGAVFNAPIVAPVSNNVMISLYGGAARFTINGLRSIKGVAGDWTEVGTDGVTATPGSNLWKRSFVNTGARYTLVINGAFTSWREDTGSAPVLVKLTQAGKWYLGSDFIAVYCVGNPATTFATIEASSDGTGWNETATNNLTVTDMDVVGFADGVDRGYASKHIDSTVRLCAGNARMYSKGGVVRNTRCFIFDCGSESITDPNDVAGFGDYVMGTDGQLVAIDFEATDTIIDNTRDDCVHLGGGTDSIASTSLIKYLSSKMGGTRIGKSGHHENVFDNQIPGVRAEIRGAYLYNNNDAANPTVDKHSVAHNYGGGIDLYDCIINARHTGTEGLALYLRRGYGSFRIFRCVLTGAGSAGATSFLDSGTESLAVCSIIACTGTTVAYRPSDGNHRLIHTTLMGGNAGLNPLRNTRSSVFANISFVSRSGPDGNGDYTYTCTNTNATSWIIVGSRIEITNLSGVSAAFNGVWDIATSARVGATDSFTIKVPATLNPPPVASIDKTGGAMWSCPRIKQLDNNLISGKSDPAIIVRTFHVDQPNYGANATMRTTATQQLWRNNMSIRDALNDDTIRRFTAAQVMAASPGAAGDLFFETSGKFGGAAWKAEAVVDDPIVYKTATSVTINNGVATVVLPNHGYQVGWKLYVSGSTPNELNFGQFVDSVIDANTFTFLVERGVANQVATGTIKVSDGTPRVAGLARDAAPSLDMSLTSTTDLQGRPMPAIRNFGAFQVAA